METTKKREDLDMYEWEQLDDPFADAPPVKGRIIPELRQDFISRKVEESLSSQFTFFYQIGDEGMTLDPNGWQEIVAHTMIDAVRPALSAESKLRQIPLPTMVYIHRENAPRWSNGAPQVVHAYKVDQ